MRLWLVGGFLLASFCACAQGGPAAGKVTTVATSATASLVAPNSKELLAESATEAGDSETVKGHLPVMELTKVEGSVPGLDLSLLPDASAGHISFHFAVPPNQTIYVETFDIEGKILNRVSRILYEAEVTFSVDFSHLEPRQYLIRIAGQENRLYSSYLLEKW